MKFMSNEELARRILGKIDMHILAHLPKPDCATKQGKWKWDVEQVKKKVALSLYQGGLGIKIEV